MLNNAETEKCYWSELLENQPIKTVATQLLKRLRYNSHGILLDLYPQHIRPLAEYFRASARQHLSLRDLDKQERINAKNHPVLMPELAFEGQGKNEEAAALYVLEHDLSVNNGNAYTEFVQWILRFKLANALDTIDGQEVFTKQHIALIEEVAEILKETNAVEGVPPESLSVLKFHFFEWLGNLYNREKNYLQASEALLIASENAQDFDLKIANTSLAADAMFNGGDEQAAFRLMESVRPGIDEILDKEIRELWERIYGRIRYEMGAQGHGAPGVLQSEPARLLVDTMESWLRNESPPDEAKLDEFVAWINRARSELSDSDARGQFNLILGLLRIVSALDYPQQWQALMNEAEALEQKVEDIQPRLQRRLLLARQKTFIDPDEAIEVFQSNWPDIQQHLRAEEQLSATGFYLDAQIRRLNGGALETVKTLVDNTLELYRQLIEAQPGSAKRRRIRETHQRAIESALAALLTVADQQGQESETGQRALSRAWRLLMATRNPELMASLTNHSATEHDPDRKRLEDGFHASLRRELRQSENYQSPRRWQNKLSQLLDHELSHHQTSIRFDQRTQPGQNLALGFFQFRELINSQPLVILGHYQSRYWVQQVESSNLHIERLMRWRDDLANGSDTDEIHLGESAAALFQQVLLNPDSEEPWLLFPDGALNTLPLEMLPDAFSADPIGARQPMQMVLGSLKSQGNQVEKLDFTRGWLACGGVPATPTFNTLPGTVQEVTALRSLLEGEEYPCRILQGAGAHAGQLISVIEDMRPAALHLAVHGVANIDYPEACALVLAEDPTSAAGEFLTFRRIKTCDLRGVQLAVLSACSSSVGRSNRSAGLEGLVWAFLQSGVKQVIASRYPVGDLTTATFMATLYRYLLLHPVAKAMQLTRRECLRTGMPVREVAAWGVWS